MTEARRRFLMTMWEGGGTIPPEMGVAKRLVARGHTVHVLGDPTIAERAEAAGCSFSSWERAPHRTTLDPEDDLFKDWEVKNPVTMIRNARDRFMAGPAAEFAADTMRAITASRPDAVLADGLIFGSIIGAQAASLPVAAVMPNIWMAPTPGVPTVGPGFLPARTPFGRGRDALMRFLGDRLVFRGGLPALNAARTDLGLAPLTSFWDQLLGADRVFMLTSAHFDFAAPHAPDHVRYLGPVLDDPPWAEQWVSPWAADDPRPLVLVGFSSTYQDQADVLRRVVDALAALPVRAVVTLGQMLDDGAVESTENVAVVRSAPHNLLLEEAAAVVTHCGHGTTMKALAAGVPLVCIPMGRDQNDTAARVVHQGAGVRVPVKAKPGRIAKAIRSVLDDPDFGSHARRMAAAIAEEQATVDLVVEIEALVSAPVAV